MKQTLQGNQILSGKNGMIYWDGEPIMEVEAFESKITTERSEIDLAMKMGRTTKLNGTVGEGTMTLKKVYSRGYKRFFSEWKAGRDPISSITALLDSPTATDDQNERITLEYVWINELPLTSFEQGDHLTAEIPFGFDPDYVDIQETID